MQQLALVYVAWCYMYYITRWRQHLRRRVHCPPTQSIIERERVHDELMNQLRRNENVYNMHGSQAFYGLCDILWRDGGLQDTRIAIVEE